MLLELGYLMLALGTPDTARDVMQAARICSGEAYSLTGPQFTGRFYLGPFWFYLIAPWACTANPLLTVGIAVWLVSAMKYPLAHALGARLVSREFAVVWLPFLALLAWPSTLIIYTHTNGLVTLLLASVALAVACGNSPRSHYAFLLGLALAFALNLHPSAFPGLALVLFPLWRAFQRRQLARVLLFIALGGVLPFVPVIIAMFRDEAVATANSGALSILNAGGLVKVPHYLWQMVTGPVGALAAQARPDSIARIYLWTGYGIVCTFAAYGLASLVVRRQRVKPAADLSLVLLAAVVTCAALVTLIRARFPYYMLLIAAVPFSALLAVGAVQFRAALRTLLILMTLTLLVSTLAAHVLARERGSLRIPIGEYYDLGESTIRLEWLPGYYWISARDFVATRAFVCRSDIRAMHGYILPRLNDAQGLLTNDCRISEGGIEAEWLTLPKSVWKRIRKVPVRYVGDLGLSSVIAKSAQADPATLASDYPPSPDWENRVTRTLELRAPCQSLVLLSNLHYFFPMEIFDLEVSAGDPVTLHSDEFATIFKLDSCTAGTVDWKVTLRAGDLSPIDFVAF